MTTPDFCQHERPQGSQLTAAGVRVCEICDKPIKPPDSCVKMSEQDLSFARWQIKQHLRMIREIRQRYGIQE